MKHYLLGALVTIVLAAALTGCHSDNKPRTREESPTVTPLDFLPALKGDYFRLDSEIVGRPYHIYVRYPEGYEDHPDRQYPVIYLLDGDSLFPILAANHLFLHYDDLVPDAIVVGIAYGGFDPSINWRDVDFSTPTESRDRSGGAANFHLFLERELLPAVESRYRADARHRILYGQSLGGFMVLYSAFNHPDLFWGRIAGNPSFQPDMEQFFATPAEAARDDLLLVLSSAQADRFRQKPERARAWHEYWRDRPNAPWDIHFNRMETGTHAANSPDIYRYGLRQIFREEIETARRQAARREASAGH
ncbi:alpha/beta hydrolase [Microbulbifer sediminum]|uniref:alpha/beta hydrolase n=1 Tax=Microbulbifer sediminum TaxID=2904250 RepID=UPI001F1CFBC3|nr:alpha/beta hydrolase-fold protein [Microbulbifer sediminum]